MPVPIGVGYFYFDFLKCLTTFCMEINMKTKNIKYGTIVIILGFIGLAHANDDSNIIMQLIGKLKGEKEEPQKVAKIVVTDQEIPPSDQIISTIDNSQDVLTVIEKLEEEANEKAAIEKNKQDGTGTLEKQIIAAKSVMVDPNNDLEVTLEKLKTKADLEENRVKNEKAKTVKENNER
jgi:hypothetical protein